MMDFSVPFTRNSNNPARELPRPTQQYEYELPLGDYINTCVKSGLDRSTIGNGDRLRLLAEGSACKVYRSKIQKFQDDGSMTSTPAVVKILRGHPSGIEPSNYSQKREYQVRQLEAAVREVQVLLHPPLMQHSNIIQLLEFGFNTQGGESDDFADEKWQQMQPFLVLEYATEKTLREFAVAHPTVDTSILRELTLDMAAGLEALHACEIVHGDFKLDNVLVFQHPERGFVAKLSDFSHSIPIKSAAEYLGTERYRPPELSTSADNIPLPHEKLLSCDMWSFGISIFELLSRKELILGEKAARSLAESALDDEEMGLRLSSLEDCEVDMWTELIPITLEADPLKRATARMVRVLLDRASRCQTPVQRTVDCSRMTVLEIQAQRATFDEKYCLFQMIMQLGFCGAPQERSSMKFQTSQGHTLGMGIPVNDSKAFFALVFALDGTQDEAEEAHADPSLLSIAQRLTGSDLQGKGYLSEEISAYDDMLAKETNEIYYSQRLKLYRALTITRLKTMNLRMEPPLPGIETWQGLSEYLAESDVLYTGCIAPSEKMFDITDLDGMLLLHYLCLIGDISSVRIILAQEQHSELLGSKDVHGNTALHFACMGGHADIALHLIQIMPALAFIANIVGTLPLHWLVMFPDEDIETMTEALSHPDTQNASSKGLRIPFHFLWLRGPPIHWAVSCRNQKVLMRLLKAGVNIDEEHQGYTALAKAVELHVPEIVHLLLENGARLDSIGDFGRSAMHFVAGNAPIIKRRIVHGTAQGRNGDLKKAVRDTMAKLEFYGCQINATDKLGNTPLHKAVASPFERGSVDDLYVIRALIQNDADRNRQNSDGDTVLHLAIKTKWCDRPNHMDLFKLLLDDSVPLMDETPIRATQRDRNGRDPLLLTALVGEGAEYIKLLQGTLNNEPGATQASFLGKDLYGNDFIALSNKSSEERIQYARAELKRLQRTGLGVSLHPDCS